MFAPDNFRNLNYSYYEDPVTKNLYLGCFYNMGVYKFEYATKTLTRLLNSAFPYLIVEDDVGQLYAIGTYNTTSAGSWTSTNENNNVIYTINKTNDTLTKITNSLTTAVTTPLNIGGKTYLICPSGSRSPLIHIQAGQAEIVDYFGFTLSVPNVLVTDNNKAILANSNGFGIIDLGTNTVKTLATTGNYSKVIKLSNGKYLCFGATNANIAVYDPETDEFVNRTYASSDENYLNISTYTTAGDGSVFIGGYHNSSYSTLLKYDPDTDTFTRLLYNSNYMRIRYLNKLPSGNVYIAEQKYNSSWYQDRTYYLYNIITQELETCSAPSADSSYAYDIVQSSAGDIYGTKGSSYSPYGLVWFNEGARAFETIHTSNTYLGANRIESCLEDDGYYYDYIMSTTAGRTTCKVNRTTKQVQELLANYSGVYRLPTNKGNWYLSTNNIWRPPYINSLQTVSVTNLNNVVTALDGSHSIIYYKNSSSVFVLTL